MPTIPPPPSSLKCRAEPLLVLTSIAPTVAVDHQVQANSMISVNFLHDILHNALLVSSSQSQRATLQAHIRQLPPALQELWIKVVQVCLLRISPTPSPGMAGCTCPVLTGLPIPLQLVALAAASGVCANCGHETLPWVTFPQSASAQAARTLRSVSEAAGASRDDIFNTRVAPLLIGAPEVTIIDRYAGKNATSAGLGWFLERVWSLKDVPVVLLTGNKPNIAGHRPSEVRTAVEAATRTARVNAGSRAALSLWQAHDRQFLRHAHERYVGATVLGRGVAITTGKGLSIFDGPRLSQATQFPLLLNDPVVTETKRKLGYQEADAVTL